MYFSMTMQHSTLVTHQNPPFTSCCLQLQYQAWSHGNADGLSYQPCQATWDQNTPVCWRCTKQKTNSCMPARFRRQPGVTHCWERCCSTWTNNGPSKCLMMTHILSNKQSYSTESPVHLLGNGLKTETTSSYTEGTTLQSTMNCQNEGLERGYTWWSSLDKDTEACTNPVW